MTYTDENNFYASLIYNEDTKKITIEFTGFNTDLEAKSLCYLLMEQFGINTTVSSRKIDAVFKLRHGRQVWSNIAHWRMSI